MCFTHAFSFLIFLNFARAYRKGGLRLHFVTSEGNSSPSYRSAGHNLYSLLCPKSLHLSVHLLAGGTLYVFARCFKSCGLINCVLIKPNTSFGVFSSVLRSIRQSDSRDCVRAAVVAGPSRCRCAWSACRCDRAYP